MMKLLIGWEFCEMKEKSAATKKPNSYHLLYEKLKELEDKIRNLNERIPPHSIKPSLIMELDRLEEERDEVAKRLASLDS